MPASGVSKAYRSFYAISDEGPQAHLRNARIELAQFMMDVATAVSGLITKMVSAGDGASGVPAAKMKILLLDRETVREAHLFGPWE
jgi:hypothetical protein